MLAMALLCASCAAPRDDGSRDDGYSLSRSGTLKITIATEITTDVADRIDSALAAAPPQQLLLYLDSPGGEFEAGQRIAKDVTRVPYSVAVTGDGMSCASMCTVIWAAAGERLAAPSANFGFHGIDCGDGLLCRIKRDSLSWSVREWVRLASLPLVDFLDRQNPPAFSRYGEGERNIVRLKGRQIVSLGAARPAPPCKAPSAYASIGSRLIIEALPSLELGSNRTGFSVPPKGAADGRRAVQPGAPPECPAI